MYFHSMKQHHNWQEDFDVYLCVLILEFLLGLNFWVQIIITFFQILSKESLDGKFVSNFHKRFRSIKYIHRFNHTLILCRSTQTTEWKMIFDIQCCKGKCCISWILVKFMRFFFKSINETSPIAKLSKLPF